MAYKDYNRKMNEYMKERFIMLKKKAIAYKGGKCENCCTVLPYPCYDFHHVNPEEKEFAWNRLRNQKWETVQRELDKCQLLCANCHRLEHYASRTTN